MRSFYTPSAWVNHISRVLFDLAPSLRRDLGEILYLQSRESSRQRFFQKSWQKIEHTLVYEIEKAYPSHGFRIKNSVQAPQDYTWVITPIDGEENFLYGIPYAAISIALVQDTTPIAALIYDIAQDNLYWAAQDKGAFLYQRRLSLQKSAAQLWAWSGKHSSPPRPTGMRYFGAPSLDLALVASGCLAGCYMTSYQYEDVVAGWFLVQEARGLLRTWPDLQPHDPLKTTACVAYAPSVSPTAHH